jgi:hypothetical protein
VPVDGALLRADETGGGIAHERPQLGEEAANLRRDIAFLARAHLEDLDGVGHAGAGDLLESFELLGGQGHG